MRHPTIVIKLGSSSIIDEVTHTPLLSILSLLVEATVSLRRSGYNVILVSSGAIAYALHHLHLAKRPKHLPQVQALAAIGQCRLMGLWEQLFERLGQTVAQVLITRGDIVDRGRYLNAVGTLRELLNMGVVPIINENDTLSVDEIRFGDNDTLSAITANMVQADYLFLMTDVDALYTKNPRKFPDAKAIEIVDDLNDLEADTSSAGSSLGTGGMGTKLTAARLATAAGVTTIVTKSSRPGNVMAIVDCLETERREKRRSAATPPATPKRDGHVVPTPSTSANSVAGTAEEKPAVSTKPPLHTRFLPARKPITDRRFWLLHGLAPHGTVYIDSGASNALGEKRGLLPAGVVDVDGSFVQHECVRLVEVPWRKRSQASRNASVDSPLRADFLESRPGLERLQSSSVLTPPGSATGTSTPVSSLTAADLAEAKEVGRALVEYSASEIKRLAGMQSADILSVLGYMDSHYVATRENVALNGEETGLVAATAAAKISGDGTDSMESSGTLEPPSSKSGSGLGAYVM